MTSIIAQKIKNRMAEKRFTVASLEREAGLKVHAVRNIILGKSKNPSADTLKAVADVLECTVDDLLSHEDSTTLSSPKDNEAERSLVKISEPELYFEVTQEALALFSSNSITPTFKDLSFIILEAYLYSIENNEGKTDRSFMKWLYSRNF